MLRFRALLQSNFHLTVVRGLRYGSPITELMMWIESDIKFIFLKQFKIY
jgi:hypothetical protein